jgi:death-on-curing protein
LRNKLIQHLTVDEVLETHIILIDHFGGEPGVRDLGLLESALYRPRTGYYRDIIEMTSALFESLLINHPFIDGNKRVAFFATDVFLRLNGWKLKVKSKEGYEFLIGLLDMGTCDYDHLLPWIRESIVRLD